MDALINEGIPSNPTEIILQNKFYPNGLTHQDIYNYYLKNEDLILTETKDRFLIIFFATSKNQVIVKRKYATSFYQLTKSNYNEILSGRTISIHSTMKSVEKFGIVDIDGDNWEENKRAALSVYNWLVQLPDIKDVKIIYTGKTSFHVRVYFHKTEQVDKIKQYLSTTLQLASSIPWKISFQRKSNQTILDLSSNKVHGGFITLGSLSVLGLICMEVSPSQLLSFQKEDAKIQAQTSSSINEKVNLFFESSHSTEHQMQHCYSELEIFLKYSKDHPLYWSYKLDGARCWIIVNKQTIPYQGGFKKIAKIQYLSRNNNQFENLHCFDSDVIEMCHFLNRDLGIRYPIIFDCEVTGPNQNLSELMTQLRRKSNVQHNHFHLNIFDLAVNHPFQKRQDFLHKLFQHCKPKQISFLEGNLITDINQIEQIKNSAILKGFEGIVLTDGTSSYSFGKRTRSCCKLKKFNTLELKVIGVVPGVGKFQNSLGSFICDYNGKSIRVSGQLTHEMRDRLFKEPPIGKWIEIRYLEITNDGKLRDPVFVRFRPDLQEEK